MRPISKFAIYVTLAAVLALLFAYVPHPSRRTKVPTPPVEREQSQATEQSHTLRVPGPVAEKRGYRAPGTVASESIPQAKMPAIRGVNNYGWVQLPHGTEVELVRRKGRELWVRWDGNLVKIDAALAVRGAVVLKSSATRS